MRIVSIAISQHSGRTLQRLTEAAGKPYAENDDGDRREQQRPNTGLGVTAPRRWHRLAGDHVRHLPEQSAEGQHDEDCEQRNREVRMRENPRPKIASSLKKTAKGGAPPMASPPIKSAAAETRLAPRGRAPRRSHAFPSRSALRPPHRNRTISWPYVRGFATAPRDRRRA